jgi:hypothetical protein
VAALAAALVAANNRNTRMYTTVGSLGGLGTTSTGGALGAMGSTSTGGGLGGVGTTSTGGALSGGSFTLGLPMGLGPADWRLRCFMADNSFFSDARNWSFGASGEGGEGARGGGTRGGGGEVGARCAAVGAGRDALKVGGEVCGAGKAWQGGGGKRFVGRRFIDSRPCGMCMDDSALKPHVEGHALLTCLSCRNRPGLQARSLQQRPAGSTRLLALSRRARWAPSRTPRSARWLCT